MSAFRTITDLRDTNTIERQLALREVYQKLDEAEEQADNGVPDVDGREVFARLRVRYGKKSV